MALKKSSELRQQEHRIACGRIWNLATKWKNHDESVSQDEEDYDEYEYNQNSINSYIKQIVTLESDPENICVETDDLYQQSKDFLLGMSEQIAGLSIPGIIPKINLDKIIKAPVFPAETNPEVFLFFLT